MAAIIKLGSINAKLRENIHRKRKEIVEIKQELINLEKTCPHVFENGFQGDNQVVFCLICNKDADEIFPGMAYEHQKKLVDKL